MGLFNTFSFIQSDVNIFEAYTVFSVPVYQGKKKTFSGLKTVVTQLILCQFFKRVQIHHALFSITEPSFLRFLPKDLMQNLLRFLPNIQRLCLHIS